MTGKAPENVVLPYRPREQRRTFELGPCWGVWSVMKTVKKKINCISIPFGREREGGGERESRQG